MQSIQQTNGVQNLKGTCTCNDTPGPVRSFTRYNMLLSFGLLLFSTNTIFATDFTVNSASQFNALSLSPGDVVTWINGTYSNDQRINFTANGTAGSPIILRAQTPGGVIFTGETTMDISGDHVIIEGFYWKEGSAANNHVQFRKNSVYANHSTIRNCAFNNLTPSGTDKHRWIVLYGTNNVVENCSFLNKNSPGALVLVELEYNDFNPVGHQIRNNYFYNFIKRVSGTTHAGDSETIRVGTSEFQDKSASVTVEGNYFFKADGENEIITNKSANNIYRNNTFRRCRGSLVLRHGAGATIDGNFFLGENVEGTGGIRISDSFHVITNNYIQDVISTGDKWNNPITLVGGSAASGGTSNGYQRVDDIVVAFNTIYNSESPIYYNDRSSYDPRGVLAYNAIYTTRSDIVTGDISGTGQGMQYVGNIAGGSAIGISSSGITNANANFSASGEIFKPSSSGPAANAAGSDYSATVNFDIEGRSRPNSDMDIGAHEVSGGSGSVVFSPFTNSQVGTEVGACFLDATGGTLSICAIGSSVVLSVSPLSDFTSFSGSKTITISSNVSWSVTNDQSWISVSPTSGSDNGSVMVTVTANSSGTDRSGVVTVTGGSLTRTVTVTQARFIAPVAVTDVSLLPANISLAPGGTQQLISTVSPSNATDQSVSFSSNNTSIATVSSSGLVTAQSVGSATLTVTTADGGFTDSSIITVTAPSSGTNLALNKTITATGTADADNVPANLIDGATATRWSSSGFPKSAVVDLGALFNVERTELVCYNDRAYQYVVEAATTSGGTYTQIVDRSANTTQGTATSPIIDTFSPVNARYIRITVSGASDYSGSWVSLNEFRVFGESDQTTIAVTGVSLSPVNVSLAVGETQQLTAAISPSNATDQTVNYSSNNTSVATVSSNGLVTAQSAGSATVTVTTTDGGFTDISSITVTTTTPDATNVALNKPVSPSSEQSTHPGSNVVDGDVDSRWSASGFPQSLVVDLGADHIISSAALICYNDRAYQYSIESATSSAGPYTQIVDRSNNTTNGSNNSPISDTFADVNARYVRITVTGASGYSGPWISLDELRIFGYVSTSPPDVTITALEPPLSHTEELASLKTVYFYPNPANGSVSIRNADNYQSVLVFDQTGRSVMDQPLNDSAYEVELSALVPGVYIFKLVGKDKTLIERIIKQ
ncbi:T9SS type A sorting domain-containing protein [Fulvivirga sp. M361]|uniref:chondroitinase-B domain-containing protein n=1 Tax=Fulvivirga sp. M361 TaxID=2594266 RepID=UPI00117AF447|nr:chondroitinase-B domain-containing protein [Fulvivirga sp. M361]TRX54779.1 T9SS type A sorting domain-containing protein [Fulvivirga sp. M361]